MELFGTRGVGNVTIGEICEAAGLAKRYFYAEFNSLDALLAAVLDDVMESHVSNVLASTDRDPEAWRDWLAASVQAVGSDPRLARLMLVETFGAEGRLGSVREDIIHRTVDTIMSDLLPAETVRRVDPIRLRMAAYSLSGAVTELLLAWVQGDVAATAQQVTDHLEALFAMTAESIQSGGA